MKRSQIICVHTNHLYLCLAFNFLYDSTDCYWTSFTIFKCGIIIPHVADGAPLSELSWPSSLAVVAVSFSGLFTFVFLMLACLCCKKGDIGFKVSYLLPPAGGGEESTNILRT